MSELDTQIERLDASLKVSIVTDLSDGRFEVFVPGAFRQLTIVKAESEEEAKDKVRTALIGKIEHRISKGVSEDATSDGALEVDSIKQGAKASDVEEAK